MLRKEVSVKTGLEVPSSQPGRVEIPPVARPLPRMIHDSAAASLVNHPGLRGHRGGTSPTQPRRFREVATGRRGRSRGRPTRDAPARPRLSSAAEGVVGATEPRFRSHELTLRSASSGSGASGGAASPVASLKRYDEGLCPCCRFSKLFPPICRLRFRPVPR